MIRVLAGVNQTKFEPPAFTSLRHVSPPPFCYPVKVAHTFDMLTKYPLK